MMMIATVVLLAPASVAGLYQAHQMEVGAALELRKNGHFRYRDDFQRKSATGSSTRCSLRF